MGVKYTIPFKAYDNVSWRIDIAKESFVGDAISLRGVGKQAASLEYSPENTDDPYSSFVESVLSMNILNQGNIDLNELQQMQDREFTVKLYAGEVLKWSGYLIADRIQYPLLSAPTSIRLTANSGLSLLDKLPYFHFNLQGTTSALSRCPMNYIRQILFFNLGIYLPIRWTNYVVCTAFDDDVFTGQVQWAVDNQGFYSYQSGNNGDNPGPVKTCKDILKGILDSFQCRLYQDRGRWVIRRVNDVVEGNVNYKQIAATLGLMTVVSGSENLLTQIGRSGYQFLNKDATITGEPGVKTCIVEYDANVRQNILPNGNLDLGTGGLSSLPLYWGSYGTLDIQLSGSTLDGRGLYSARLDNNTGSDQFFTLKVPGGSLGVGGLPIDADVLVKQIDFSFMFSPVEGFPVDVNGIIVWDSNPLQIKVIYHNGVNTLYLNEFGFWQTPETFVNISIPNLKIGEVAAVRFDKFRGIIIPLPTAPIVAGSTCDIQIIFKVKDEQEYFLDNISIETDRANDVYESTLTASKNTLVERRTLTISSSFGGYMLSNYMSSWDKSDTECFFRDGFVYEGTLTGLTANAYMRFRYMGSRVFNGTVNVANADWNFDKIYLIDSFADSRFLPLNSTYNIETCQVNIIAMECRNDDLTLDEKYYSSNDSPLSN